MSNKTLILLTVILLIQSINSLNSADLCISSVCNEEYSYKCTNNLCSFNKQKCIDYYKFKMKHYSNSFYKLISFQTCESYKLTENDYCLSYNNCFQTQFINTGFVTMRQTSRPRKPSKTFNKKIDCKCDGKYSFKCGEFCTIDNSYCDLLNLNIKYQKNQNKKQVKSCASLGQKIVIF
jgi:hypothetical protein